MECEVSLPFIVIMNPDSYSWTDKNRKTGLLFMDRWSMKYLGIGTGFYVVLFCELMKRDEKVEIE